MIDIVEDEDMTNLHGPNCDPMNTTDGSVVLIVTPNQDDPDFSHYSASMTSPMHQNSMSECIFKFWYYIAGDIGSDGALIPTLLTKDKTHEVFLDQLKPDSKGVGVWRESINGIGRQRGEFYIRLQLTPKKVFDAGVAIDDVG